MQNQAGHLLAALLTLLLLAGCAGGDASTESTGASADRPGTVFSEEDVYHHGLRAVQDGESGLWGLENIHGELAHPHQFDAVHDIMRYGISVESDGRFGLIDNNGDWVEESTSQVPLRVLPASAQRRDGATMLVLRNEEGHFGVITDAGEVLLRAEYSVVEFGDDGTVRVTLPSGEQRTMVLGDDLIDPLAGPSGE